MDATTVVARFARDGHVVVPGVLDAATVAKLLSHLTEHPLTPTGMAAIGIDDDSLPGAIGAEPRFIGIARLLLDGPPELFGVTYLVKPPRCGLPVLWHQDGYPWREQLGVEEALTLWVALDQASPTNGCLQVIPGSHHSSLVPLQPATDVDNVFGWQSPLELVDDTRAIDVPLASGDVSVHHPALMHRSGPNRSVHRRAALALRYRRLRS